MIACNYRAGSAQHSADGIAVSQTSRDRGATWSDPVVVFDRSQLSPPETFITGQVLFAADGSLLALMSVVVTTRPDRDFIGTEEGAAQEARCYKAHSFDDGRTWTEPERLLLNVPHSVSGRSLLLSNGELLINTPYKREDGVKMAAGTFSRDYGQSFDPIVDFHCDPDGVYAYDEAYYTVFDDGEILVLYWTWRPDPASNYRRRPAGIRLWTSHDRGLTFEPDPLQMWDADQERLAGVPVSSLGQTHGASAGDEDHAMESFTFGLPDLSDLGDGTALLTYYATIDGDQHIRACRFAVS